MNEQLAHDSDEPEGRGKGVIYLDERRPSGMGTLRPPPMEVANDIIGTFEVEFLNSLELILVNFKNLFEEYADVTAPPEIDSFQYAYYLAWKNTSLKKFSDEDVKRFSRYESVQIKWREQIRALIHLITDWHHKIFEVRRDLRDKKIKDTGGLKAKVDKYMNSLDDKSIDLLTERITEENLKMIGKYVAANLKEA